MILVNLETDTAQMCITDKLFFIKKWDSLNLNNIF